MHEDQPERAAFAGRLREVRLAYAVAVDRPLMQATEFAALLELSPAAYAAYEAGGIDPPLLALVALHRLTGVSLDWLVVGDTEGAKPWRDAV